MSSFHRDLTPAPQKQPYSDQDDNDWPEKVAIEPPDEMKIMQQEKNAKYYEENTEPCCAM